MALVPPLLSDSSLCGGGGGSGQMMVGGSGLSHVKLQCHRRELAHAAAGKIPCRYRGVVG